jgi:hypothetical protein
MMLMMMMIMMMPLKRGKDRPESNSSSKIISSSRKADSQFGAHQFLKCASLSCPNRLVDRALEIFRQEYEAFEPVPVLAPAPGGARNSPPPLGGARTIPSALTASVLNKEGTPIGPETALPTPFFYANSTTPSCGNSCSWRWLSAATQHSSSFGSTSATL